MWCYNMERENIVKVLKYNYNNEDIWIYSTQDKDENNNTLFRYYTLFLKDKIPVIIDLQNPIETLQNANINPTEVVEGSKDFMIFLAYKDIAERNIMEKIKK